MNSDRLCDTEDWSNDAENSTLITGINDNLQYVHIIKDIKKNLNLNL